MRRNIKPWNKSTTSTKCRREEIHKNMEYEFLWITILLEYGRQLNTRYTWYMNLDEKCRKVWKSV
jgi:hypothetical protein